jgi:transcriptional regulator with XRE-family HTH domain
VPNRIRVVDEATMHGSRLQAEMGRELRGARLARGVALADVASAVGESASHVSRVERGLVGHLGLTDAARHGAAVGLHLHARFYPAGGGLRDAAQLDLIRRFLARVGARGRWTRQLEAPLPIPGDLRAFDALLTSGGTRIAVEAITRLHDAQAQLRAAALKQRDGRATRLVLLLKATEHNRTALASAADIIAIEFPLGSRATLAALQEGEDPGANGIVLLR